MELIPKHYEAVKISVDGPKQDANKNFEFLPNLSNTFSMGAFQNSNAIRSAFWFKSDDDTVLAD